MNTQSMIQYFDKAGYRVERMESGWRVTLKDCDKETECFPNQKEIWDWWRMEAIWMYKRCAFWNYIAKVYAASSGHCSDQILSAFYAMYDGEICPDLLKRLSDSAWSKIKNVKLPFHWRVWALMHIKEKKDYHPLNHMIEAKSERMKRKLNASLQKSCKCNSVSRI